jgi:hypothetical protein
MESDPDTIRSFESFEHFVRSRPVFATFENELRVEGAKALKPLERTERQDGVAFPDDIQHVVANRSGSVLSASTILKSDFFSNLQKMSLPERIDGAANFRRVSLTLGLNDDVPDGKWVCGSGMPTVDGYVARLLSSGTSLTSSHQASPSPCPSGCCARRKEHRVLDIAP